MARFLIFGTESPESIERTLVEVLIGRGFQVDRRDHLEDDLYFDDRVRFSNYEFNADKKDPVDIWVWLSTRSRPPVNMCVDSCFDTKSPANYTISIDPTGFGSAVEPGAGHTAAELDKLYESLAGHLKNVEAYKSHKPCARDFQLIG
jgi:hypothetical protein